MIYIKTIAEVLERRDSELGFPPQKRVHDHTINQAQEIAMNAQTTQNLDILGRKLGEAALTLLVRLYPQVRDASDGEREAACAAMRAKSMEVVDALLDDAKAAPWVAHIAFQTAALTLAHEGIRALEAERK